VSLPRATFGIVIRDGKVVDAAPYGRGRGLRRRSCAGWERSSCHSPAVTFSLSSRYVRYSYCGNGGVEMGYVILDVGILALGAAFLFLLFRWLAKDTRRMADEDRAAGIDPDHSFLRAIARVQAKQKRRFRGPVAWYEMRYLAWARRWASKR
jgi:hypothetical protein